MQHHATYAADIPESPYPHTEDPFTLSSIFNEGLSAVHRGFEMIWKACSLRDKTEDSGRMTLVNAGYLKEKETKLSDKTVKRIEEAMALIREALLYIQRNAADSEINDIVNRMLDIITALRNLEHTRFTVESRNKEKELCKKLFYQMTNLNIACMEVLRRHNSLRTEGPLRKIMTNTKLINVDAGSREQLVLPSKKQKSKRQTLQSNPGRDASGLVSLRNQYEFNPKDIAGMSSHLLHNYDISDSAYNLKEVLPTHETYDLRGKMPMRKAYESREKSPTYEDDLTAMEF